MPTSTNSRINSIDILRGIVMLIMALDHTRDFLHAGAVTGDPLDLKTTTPLLFFTRWITHYCAPIFVFLSGLSAAIAAKKRTKAQTATFMIKRGLWLIVVELLVLTLAFTFNPLYNVVILQVIWAIGCSMVIMGLLLRWSGKLFLPVGLILVLFHNVTDLPFAANIANQTWLQVLVTARGTVVPLPANHFVFVLYAIFPWTGIMMLGYCAARWYNNNYTWMRRKQILIVTGAGLLAFFIVLRWLNIYGDPQPWSAQRSSLYTFLSFINVSKYPPSLLYTCMTIGPALLFLAFTEYAQGKLASMFTVYGKVPFFYYILHFYIIHTVTVILFYVQGYGSKDIVSPNSPFLFRPATFGYSLGVTYLIWFCIIASLYLPCRWYISYKQRHKEKWWTHYV